MQVFPSNCPGGQFILTFLSEVAAFEWLVTKVANGCTKVLAEHFHIIKCVSLFTFYRFQAIKCARCHYCQQISSTSQKTSLNQERASNPFVEEENCQQELWKSFRQQFENGAHQSWGKERARKSFIWPNSQLTPKLYQKLSA